MAFPLVQTTATTNGTTAATSLVLNMPSGIVADDLLVMFLRAAVEGTGFTFPAGWTKLFDDTSDASNDETCVAWRKADGTEGATITVTTSASTKFASLAYRIKDTANPTTTPPEFATLSTGFDSFLPMNALSPTGGIQDYLFLAMGAWEGEQTSPPTIGPTSYTDIFGADSGITGNVDTNCRVASARRQNRTATEASQGIAWKISTADDFTTTNIAIFPKVTVRATASTEGSTAATNKVCNLPAGINADETLLLLLRSAGGDTHSTPTGWTALFLNNTADASDDTTSLWWRKADGAEAATVTVNGTASLKFAALAYLIAGAADPAINTPAFATLVTGNSTLPDPGALTPPGGSQAYLWIWMGAWEGEQSPSPPTGTPTNYIDTVGANSLSAGAVATNCQVAAATRNLTAASENPGSWTISASDQWTATVVAIYPIQPSPPPSAAVPLRMLMGIGV